LQLALLSTNLYTDPTETNLGQEKIVQPSTSNGGVFGIGTAIELNFDDIPDGAKVSAILRKGTAATGIINARVLPSDNTVTVTPAQPLELDTEYTLAVRIYDGNRTLWSVPTATDTTGSSTGVVWIKKSIALEADSRIVFRTASKQQYLITGTNLYFDPETGEVKPPANNLKNFATNGVIELYFNELPAGATVKNLVLKNAAGGDITVASAVNVDAKTITVTLGAGVVLDANKLYYLSLRVVPYPESNTAIWTVANDPGSFINRVNTLGVDGKSYIVFNTVEADTAELVSAANLYDEDDPVLYAEPKFALNGTIELTFKAGSIPANARIGISELRATNYTSALLPSYSVLDHANSKVTIKPESPLTHTTKYYLRLTLTKPGQNEPVWEPVTYAGIIPTDPDDLSRPLNEAQSKGVSGPVYIEYKGSSAASGRGYIVFTSAPKLDIINAATTNVSNITVTKQFDNVTDQPNGIDTQNFNPNNNIIIQFNLPIKTVNKAQVWLFRNGSTRGTTGSADATKLRNDRKVLDIEIPYRLAANETFKIRIDVVSDDDQVLRYDSSNTTTATGDDINLRTSGLTTGSKGVNTISGLTFNGVQNPFGNTTDSVPITFTPPSLNIAVEYFVLTGRQNSWEATGTSIGTVSMSSVAPRNGNAVLQTRNPNEVRFNDELNQIKIRGISNQGYVTESNVLTLTFN
jgi:hypothetical protein